MFDFTKEWALPEELEKRIERTEARIEQLQDELAELEKEAGDLIPAVEDFVSAIQSNPCAVWRYYDCDEGAFDFAIKLMEVDGAMRFIFAPRKREGLSSAWRPLRYLPGAFELRPFRMLTPDETKGAAQ